MKKITMVVLAMGLVVLPMIVKAETNEMPVVAKEAAKEVAEIEVGNKICPVSGDKVGAMSKSVKMSHNGKVYNLCCGMCVKDFNANPDKYTKIAEDEVAAGAVKKN